MSKKVNERRLVPQHPLFSGLLKLFFQIKSVFTKTVYRYIAQADLGLLILLPQPSKCWDYRCVTPQLAPRCKTFTVAFVYFISTHQSFASVFTLAPGMFLFLCISLKVLWIFVVAITVTKN
jgi:hypothetical protein